MKKKMCHNFLDIAALKMKPPIFLNGEIGLSYHNDVVRFSEERSFIFKTIKHGYFRNIPVYFKAKLK